MRGMTLGRSVPPWTLLTVLVFTALGTPLQSQAPTGFDRAWQVGTPVTVIGELTVIYGDDFARQRVELWHSVKDEETGEHLRLRYDGPLRQELRTGMRVVVRGRRSGGEIYLADGGSGVTVSNTSAPPTVTPVSGDQRTLVIVANFRDRAVGCSMTAITDTMFTDPNGRSVDAVYRDNSDGCVSFSGTVVGPYSLGFASTDPCDPTGWGDAAEGAALAAGVNLTAYPRKVFVLPANSCGMSGYGSVGGATSRAWVFSCTSRRLFQHELGHNLGMMHASTPASEYGDNTDPMGIYVVSNVFGFNGPHRYQMGWLDTTSMLTVEQSGFYEVAPLGLGSSAATAPRVLAVRKPDTGEYYFFGYRIPVGFDSFMEGTYFYRLSVHRYRPGTTPFNTYFLAGLADGENFHDTVNGITVTQVSHGATHAVVQVSFNNPCVPAPPSVAVSPASQSGTAGSTLSYQVAITNNDTTLCAASTFAGSRVLPSGWTGSVLPSTVTLNPAATGAMTLTVTSQVGAAAASYGVTVNVTDTTVAVHTASAGASYTVLADAPPSAPSNLKATVRSKQKQITLTWSAASDDRGVTGYVISRNGAVAGSSTTTSWVDSVWSAGATYAYVVKATDSAGQSSPPSNSVSVTLPGGGGKGR